MADEVVTMDLIDVRGRVLVEEVSRQLAVRLDWMGPVAHLTILNTSREIAQRTVEDALGQHDPGWREHVAVRAADN